MLWPGAEGRYDGGGINCASWRQPRPAPRVWMPEVVASRCLPRVGNESLEWRPRTAAANFIPPTPALQCVDPAPDGARRLPWPEPGRRQPVQARGERGQPGQAPGIAFSRDCACIRASFGLVTSSMTTVRGNGG